jgi:hypothetical protein
MKKNPTTKQNADRFVHAIFCDDIRQEMGNKVSFMGCYQGELFVPFVPLMLPKLCVQVTISTTVDRPIKSLTVRLDQGENQLAVIEVPADDFVRSMPPVPEEAKRWSASVGVMLSPFNITEPGELRVVVITEEGEMPGPRLRLKVRPPVDGVVAPGETVAPIAATRKVAAKKHSTRRAPAKKAK